MRTELDLGALKTEFGPNKANARVILVVMPVFILVGLILMASLPVAGISMLVIAAGLFWGYRAQMKARVQVFEHGLVATPWRGKADGFTWQEVEAVYESIGYHQTTGRPNQRVYRVNTRDGRQVKLDMTYERIQQLGIAVQKETGNLLLPAAQEILRSGGAVAFGEHIALSMRGFISAGEVLPWEQVEKIRLTSTADLSIHRQGTRLPWKLVMHHHIANFRVFHTLLHEAVKGTPAELRLEDPFERSPSQDEAPSANIGTVSAAIGTDVRDLLMDGYTMPEIQRVVQGEITLAELRRAGPASKK